MNAIALTVLLGTALPAQAPRDNLDFAAGTLAGWRGHGFYLTTADHRGPSTLLGVCSSDRGQHGRTGILRYTFTVPAAAARLHCTAYASCRHGLKPDSRLDVLLLTDQSEVVPKKVKGPLGWQNADGLLPRQDGRPREYAWELDRLAGRRVQLVLVDDDARPGCHLFCSGFHLIGTSEGGEPSFAQQMKRLARDKGLPPMSRFESKHFVAWSNADADFTGGRLRDCELIYQLFWEHFRRRGFTVRTPAGKMMVAAFDSQAGFQAYLDFPIPRAVTGVYRRDLNQLALYDLSQDKALLASKEKAFKSSEAIHNDLARLHYLETVHRRLGEWSKDNSISTAMHETAHLLSFNCGLLNRRGDVPAWLSEGLACYCEATDQGRWQGIGEPNPDRTWVLAVVLERRGNFIPLRDLLLGDTWRMDSRTASLGYSQSWALFRFLMHERPAALRAYLELIYPRQAPDHRLADFGQAFGADVPGLERRYFEYLRKLAFTAPKGRAGR
jgi:hypothetical protein